MRQERGGGRPGDLAVDERAELLRRHVAQLELEEILKAVVFFALACQCISTLSVVRRETRSWRWPAFLFGYMTLLAYAASFLVYQGGRLLGF